MGGKHYVENVCVYVATFRLCSGTITEFAHLRAGRRRYRGGGPIWYQPDVTPTCSRVDVCPMPPPQTVVRGFDEEPKSVGNRYQGQWVLYQRPATGEFAPQLPPSHKEDILHYVALPAPSGPRDRGEVATSDCVPLFGDPPECKGCVALLPTCGPLRRQE